jgi:hypothetical protein
MNDQAAQGLKRRFHRRQLALAVGGFSACMLFMMTLATGCSSSSSPNKSDSGTSTGGRDGSLATNGDSGDAGVPSVCDKIARADIQALLPATGTSVDTIIGGGSNGGIGCSVNVTGSGVGGLLIQTYPTDTDKSKFTALLGGDLSNPSIHSISGIGDEAYYGQLTDDAGDGVSSPELAAHKNSGAAPSCGIESNDPPNTTMKTTSDGIGGFTVTQSDTIAYVQLMGKVCNDVFAASN